MSSQSWEFIQTSVAKFSNFVANINLLSIFIVGSILNFLPLFFGGFTLVDPATKSYPEYLERLYSFEYCASLVASLATTIPILVDYLFDRFLRIVEYDGSSIKEDTSGIYVPLRETIAILIVPDVLILFWIIPFGLFDYLMVLSDARDTLYTYALLVCLVKCKTPVWTWKSLVFIGGPLMVNNILLSFSSLSNDSDFVENIGAASLALTSVGLFSLLVNAVLWFRYFFRLSEQDATMESYLCSAYVTFTVVFLLGDWVPLFFPSQPGDPWSSVGLSYLTCYSYLMASCTMCLSVISTRCAGIDATRVGRISFCICISRWWCKNTCMYCMCDVQKLLSAKAMFMRYISHEIRTPLNAACLGMKILCDELKRLGLPTLLDTAVDTEKSCKAAVDVLNDMLLYDKISSGLMTLEKRLLDPLEFIANAVRPFQFQVQ